MPVDDEPDDTGPYSPPLPPEDRLWRHPSEMGGERPAVGPAGAPRPWGVAVLAGLIGAALATGVVVLIGGRGERVVERRVLERVAVAPVVSTQPDDSGLEALFREASPAIARLSVERPEGQGVGSGVVFRSDGHLLTAAHVVAGATSIEVVLADGRKLAGAVLGSDPMTDIAVVKVDATDVPTIVLGHGRELSIGESVVAIGSPLGFDDGPSVTAGVVSALDRRLDVPGGEPLHGMIQTDAPLADGSSGGALLDRAGTLVGITTAIAGDRAGGFGFATPVDVARRIAEEIIETGAAHHVWLGVQGGDLALAGADALGVPGGVEVREVVEGSPAGQAGLAPGDVITEIDGAEVRSMSALVMALRARRPGDRVTLGYWHQAEHRTTTIVLDERPAR